MKIYRLIEGITSGFPIGAAMFLANGGEHIRFKYRTFEVMDSISEVTPGWLVPDGQQRLTTPYQVLKSKKAINTRSGTSRNIIIRHYHCLNIRKCLGSTVGRLEAVIPVLEKKQLTTNIGRDTMLDSSTREKEFENLMSPLNITFSHNDTED